MRWPWQRKPSTPPLVVVDEVAQANVMRRLEVLSSEVELVALPEDAPIEVKAAPVEESLRTSEQAA